MSEMPQPQQPPPKKRRRGLILALFLFFGLLAVGTAVTVGLLLGDSGAPIGESSWLELSLSGALAEQPNSDPLMAALGPIPMSLLEVDSALRKAAADDRIEGVLIRPGGLGVGFAGVQDLRDAILRFRESGKPAVCWLEAAENKDYLLATACDEIYIAPEGMLVVNGLSMEMTFIKGTLEKLGVEAEFTRLGAYKSAVETYTRDSMSEASREQMNAIADSLFGQLVGAIAEARSLSPEQVRALIDAPPITAQDALEANLVDGRLYMDELETQLAGESGVFEAVSLGRYNEVAPATVGLGGGPEVAIVYANGQIMGGESDADTVGSDTLVETLRELREDDSVEAVVLRVNSPGGSGLASDLIWRELELTRAEKPVIASMGDTAASGGYYIAMGADAIVAQPGTITGSIGVFAGKFNLEGLFTHIGMTSETIARGDQAEMFSMTHGLDEAERETLSAMVEQFYATFVTKVAASRERSWEDIHAVSQGRVWTGEDAHRVGLVDELGGLRDAIALAKEAAGLSVDDEVSLVPYPKQPTLLEQLLEGPNARAEVEMWAQLADELPLWFHLLPPELIGSVRMMVESREARMGAPLVLLPYALTIR